MRIALLKIGSRVAENLEGIAAGEALSICRLLMAADESNEVTVYTKVLAKDKNDAIRVSDIEEHFDDILDNDIMVVINGNVAFFGGGESVSDCMTYKAMGAFRKKIFYILCDPAIKLKQINVKSKTWGEKYASDNYLTLDSTHVSYICQAHNIGEVVRSIGKGCVPADDVRYFPFEKFPMFLTENRLLPFNESPEYDISYGGTFRSGRREKDMLKWFFGHADDVSMEVFGKIREKDFKKLPSESFRRPIWNGPVDYSRFQEKMNNALSTIVIGDPVYIKSEDIAQRVYESILANCVTFIDKGYDIKRHVYSNEELIDFCYVGSVRELDDKVRVLKSDDEFRKRILSLQYEDTKVDIEKYKQDIMSILRD